MTPPPPPPPTGPPPRLRGRLALLLACLAAGVGVAWLGQALWPSQAWWLAVPAALALGWLGVADPTRCRPPR